MAPANLVTPDELRHLGYRALDLTWLARTHLHDAYGLTRDFDLTGQVPEAAGIYLFTIADHTDELSVMYVGLTTHLWMVTLGRLSAGQARGGQRYGRPRHAGVTRKRVNSHLTRHAGEGTQVQQWVRVHGDRETLRQVEEDAITRFSTRRLGYNLG